MWEGFGLLNPGSLVFDRGLVDLAFWTECNGWKIAQAV